MGIQGLLVALKPYCSVAGNVRQFEGQAIAVDTSSWLHKSVYSIADHYVECIESKNTVRLDEKCVAVSASYIIKRCEELLHDAGVTKIYLVLDGQRCPLKAVTNEERERVRHQNLSAARQLRQSQPSNKDAIFEKYKACIKVIPELVTRVAEQVQRKFGGPSIHANRASHCRVELIWSPYEADAQMVQLALDGRCTAIVTEDSDVLVYAAAVQSSVPILYKLERISGQCEILSMDWLLNTSSASTALHTNAQGVSRQSRASSGDQRTAKSKDKTKHGESVSTQFASVLHSFVARQKKSPGWGTRLFVQACVLAGCDYAPRQLPGVGLVTAFKYVRMAGLTGSVTNLQSVFDSIVHHSVPVKARRTVPDLTALVTLLAQAEAVFYHHPVALTTGRVVYLTTANITHRPHTTTPDMTSSNKHAPVLTRFQGQLDFLGSLVTHNPCQDDSSGIIPRHILRRQEQQQSQHQANSRHDFFVARMNPTLNGSRTSLTTTSWLPDHYRAVPLSNKHVRPMFTVNPYQTTRVRTLEPCHTTGTTTNTVTVPPIKPLSPLKAYARRHREEGIAQSNKIVTARLPVRRSRDCDDGNHHLISPRTKRQRMLRESTVTREHGTERQHQLFDRTAAVFRTSSTIIDENSQVTVDSTVRRPRDRNSPIAPAVDNNSVLRMNRSNTLLDVGNTLSLPSTKQRQFHFLIGALKKSNTESTVAALTDEAMLRNKEHRDDDDDTQQAAAHAYAHDSVEFPVEDYADVGQSPKLLDDSERQNEPLDQLSLDERMNPAPHSLQLENVATATSAYFGGVHTMTASPRRDETNIYRRVTLDHLVVEKENCLPEPDRVVIQHEGMVPTFAFPLEANPYSVYDFDDDVVVPYMSSRTGSNTHDVINLCGFDNNDDDTATSNQCETFPGVTSQQSSSSYRSSSAPKVKSSIGPAKTFRDRFGTAPGTKAESRKGKGLSVIRQFINQNTKSGHVFRSVTNRKETKHDANQTSLLDHFAVR